MTDGAKCGKIYHGKINGIYPKGRTKMNKTKFLSYCAIFAALTAVLSQISLPIGPVPINLALMSPVIAALLFGIQVGVTSQAVYVLLGAVGLPVFSGFRGGLSALAGPTGGYIIGYILCALLAGAIIKYSKEKSVPMLVLAAVAGTLICYLFGTIWFVYQQKTTFAAALSLCVFPFLPGDAVKIVLDTLIVRKISKTLNNQ